MNTQLTKKQTKTHTQVMRDLYESNRLFILRKMEEGELEYFTRILEFGCLYAEIQMSFQFYKFPKQMMQLEIERLTYNKSFWLWWQNEYKTIEREIIQTAWEHPNYTSNSSSNELVRDIYTQRFQHFAHDENLAKSFNNFYERVIS